MPDVIMNPVASTMISEIGYDEASAELHVRFTTGRVAVYSGVPPRIAQQVSSAPSIGRAFHELLRNRYEHRYL